jgi:hypothetical protein
MIGYDRFSALRLRHLFPPAVLEAFRFYTAAPDEGPESLFDDEYMGGSWFTERIDGVTLWLSERRGSQVGIVQVSGGPYPNAAAVAGYPEPFTGPFLDPTWTANANQALAALDLGLRIGDPEEAVWPIRAGSTRRADFRDGARQFVNFALHAPDLYHVQGICHRQEGLLHLEILRPDLIRANQHDPDEGGYDLCFGGMFDEGPETGA